MSEENVEIMRRSFVVEPRRSRTLARDLDPGIGWDISSHPLPDVPNRGRGREALTADMFATYLSGWNDYFAELKEVCDAGEHVIVVLHETATMRDTGVPLEPSPTR
jgi:hypothetical protein